MRLPGPVTPSYSAAMNRLQGSLWEGVALRRTRAAADPDAPPRPVALPAAWEEEAAAALVALVAPGQRPVSLPRAAEAWIARATSRGLRAGMLEGPEAAHRLAEALRALLLTRRAAPGLSVWRGQAGETPRFVLSLPAFLEAEGGFDAEGFAEACAIGVRTLDALGCGKALRLSLGFADLAGLLAGLGLPYDSAESRDVAAALAALARGAAEGESGRLAQRLGARHPLALIWPSPPATTAVPGLAEAARAALAAAATAPGLRHQALIALAPADATEALLGAETAGIAPAPGATRSVLGPAGVVEVPSRAALRLGAPDRVARLLGPVAENARQAMRDAVSPFLDVAPPLPVSAAEPPRRLPAPAVAPWRRPALPMPMPLALTAPPLHVTIGGHRVALHRALDDAGRLVEIGFSVGRDAGTASMRGLLEGFAAAVSLGLAQGVPLTHYVDCFAHARIGPPGGVVAGDPEIRRCLSVLDWAFRRLAIDLLGRRDLADPTEAELVAGTAPRGEESAAQAPLLPLDLPRHPLPSAGAARPEAPLPAPPRRRRGAVRLAG
jgi:hypothetical protein